MKETAKTTAKPEKRTKNRWAISQDFLNWISTYLARQPITIFPEMGCAPGQKDGK